MSNRCRSCKAPIAWAVTQKGRRIPLDPEPTADGNVVLSEAVESGMPPTATVLAPGTPMPVGVMRYTSHFATCPDAPRHRRSR